MLLEYMFRWKDIRKLTVTTTSFATKSCVFKRLFGNLGITSSLESVLASALQNFIFAFRSFFWKNRAFLFIPFLSYGISTILLQILISLRFPIKPPKGVNWCSRKRLFEFSEAYVHWCFEKITARKIPAYFLAKNPGWSPFQYTRRFSWNFS